MTGNSDHSNTPARRARLEWGRRGARLAAERGDLLIVVDTLSFSTAVATAIHGAGIVYPCADGEGPAAFAERVGAELAVHRWHVLTKGQFSLSPVSFLNIEAGTRVVLTSPNGATCSRYARSVPHLLTGALVNASAVAKAATRLMESGSYGLTVLACGERWRDASEDGALRVAIEDYLGAGAILSEIPCSKSAEARLCEAAFLAVRDDLDTILWECDSGRELHERGFGDDVRHASRLNLYDAVPVLRDERFLPF